MGEVFVYVDQCVVFEVVDQQIVGVGMEGVGEFFFGDLQQFLGFYQVGDVVDYYYQCWGLVEGYVLGVEQCVEGIVIVVLQGYFEVGQVVVVEFFQDLWVQVGECLDVQFGGGFVDGVVGGDVDLLFEGVVYCEEVVVGVVGQYYYVWVVVEY